VQRRGRVLTELLSVWLVIRRERVRERDEDNEMGWRVRQDQHANEMSASIKRASITQQSVARISAVIISSSSSSSSERRIEVDAFDFPHVALGSAVPDRREDVAKCMDQETIVAVLVTSTGYYLTLIEAMAYLDT